MYKVPIKWYNLSLIFIGWIRGLDFGALGGVSGWVDAVPDDTSFWIGNSFETHQESPELISGSDLTNATPLHVRLEYEGTTVGTDNFFEGKTTSDPFTSFVHIDAVLRLQQDGTLISSV